MRKHIVITAGGTIEPIDSVRNIQNTSTGSLCACIYEALADRLEGKDTGFVVDYIVSETAVLPAPRKNLPVTFYPVTDVKSVEEVLLGILSKTPVVCILHGMAVSDYTKNYVIDIEELTAELAGVFREESHAGEEKIKERIKGILENPENPLDTSKKIHSGSDLMLSLKQTPKLIEKIRSSSPEAFLVGFKLLKDVSEEELISVASALSEKNGCDMVLANDLKDIDSQIHKGILLRNKSVVGRYTTKKGIAEGIVEQVFYSVFGADWREDL